MSNRAHRTLYPDRLNFRVPAEIRQAVEAEAVKARCGPGEYARRLILAGLNAQGVTLPEPATRTA